MPDDIGRLPPRVGALLRAITRGGDLDRALVASLDAGDWATVVHGAATHRIVGLANAALSTHETVPADVRAALRGESMQALANHLRTLTDLRTVIGLLDGLSWATFKGPYLAAIVYRRPDLRSYGDLDLLIDPADFGVGVERLEAAGFHLHDANWPMLEREMLGEVHFTAPGGTVIDFHWDLVNIRKERERLNLSTREFLARRRFVDIAGLKVPTFSPEDTLVHVAWHAAAGGGDRLGWLADVRGTAADHFLDWNALVDRATATRTRRAVAVMLGRSRAIAGARVPRSVLRRLVPTRTYLAVDAAGRRAQPIERDVSGHSAPSHISRYAVDDGVEAFREFAALASRRLRRLNIPPPQETVMDAVGGPVERASYIEAVRRTTETH